MTTPLTVQSGFNEQKKASPNGLALMANFEMLNLVSLKQAGSRAVVRMVAIAKVAFIGTLLKPQAWLPYRR